MKKITIISLGGMGSNFLNFVNKDLKKDISDIEINTLLLNPKELDKDFIKNSVQKDEQVFVVVALGGSSSNVLIELVDIFKEINIKPCLIVLKPFIFESKEKIKLANSTIEKLNNLDNLKIFDNNDLNEQCDDNTSMKEVFELMDKNIFKFIIESVN